MIRCPVCKADNSPGPQCRRCKADLSLLIELEKQRAELLGAAAERLRSGRHEEALAQAARAHHLRKGEDAARLLAIIHLLRYDFRSAWQHYEQAHR